MVDPLHSQPTRTPPAYSGTAHLQQQPAQPYQSHYQQQHYERQQQQSYTIRPPREPEPHSTSTTTTADPASQQQQSDLYRFPVPKYVYGLEHLHIRPSAGCTCKKSRCLKLYCQCFSSSNVCADQCKCGDCHNTEQHGKHIEMARRTILHRNPLAFRRRQGSWRPNRTLPNVVTPPCHRPTATIASHRPTPQMQPNRLPFPPPTTTIAHMQPPPYTTYQHSYNHEYQHYQHQPTTSRTTIKPSLHTTTTMRPKETDAMIAAIAMTQLGHHSIRQEQQTPQPQCRLPKGISFRKICSQCGRSRSDHADAGFGNACTFRTCGKCGRHQTDHTKGGGRMGVACDTATHEQQRQYSALLEAWAEAATVKRALQQRHEQAV